MSRQLADVQKNGPTGNMQLQIGDYISRPHQLWTITGAPDFTGYLGGPYYKIVLAGTDRSLGNGRC